MRSLNEKEVPREGEGSFKEWPDQENVLEVGSFRMDQT